MKKCANPSCNNRTNNPRFCSKSCSATTTNKEVPKRIRKTKCKKCDNITKSYRNTLCEKHHKEYMESKSSFVEELTLEEIWNKESLKDLHPSSRSAYIRTTGRTKFKDLLKQPCANCGYDKHVELCHIKPIRDFLITDKLKDVNSTTNVVQLCPNCHWEFDKGLFDITKIVASGRLELKP